jgi:hypothetical protein
MAALLAASPVAKGQASDSSSLIAKMAARRAAETAAANSSAATSPSATAPSSASLSAINPPTTRPLPEPVVITLQYTNAPLQKVLDDFAGQAGAEMGVHGQSVEAFARDRKITVDLDHSNFWHALRVIMDASGLHLQSTPSAPRLVLDPNPQNYVQLDFSGDGARAFGPFLVVPQATRQVSTVQYAHGGHSDAVFDIRLYVLAEPRLQIVGGQNNQRWLVECTDDLGNSLVPNGRVVYGGIESGWWWQIYSPLKNPAKLGTRITKLRGDLKFDQVVRSEPLAIDDLARLAGVSRKVGSNTYTFNQFIDRDADCQILMKVQGPAALAPEIRMTCNSIELTDDNGNSLPLQGQSTGGGPEEWNITLTYSKTSNRMNFGAVGPSALIPKKLRWDVPVETQAITVPFELHDLELPHRP